DTQPATSRAAGTASRTSRRPTSPPRSRLLTLEQRDALDVRRVREHVDRPRTHEPVAVVVAQPPQVARERGRVARDVHDARRAALAEPLERLPREPGPGRVDDDDVGIARAVAQLLEHLADVSREERRVADAVQLRVLDRARDRLLRDLDAPDRQRARG